jgi:hypothetical protein
MKVFFASILLAAAAFASVNDSASLTGKWQVHIRVSDREAEDTCTFVQKGNDLTGSCTSERGTGSITGKVEDKKVAWVYKSSSDANGPITLSYQGAVISSGNLSGSVTVEEYGVSGEFTATLAN